MPKLAQQYHLDHWAPLTSASPDAINQLLKQLFANADEMFQVLFDNTSETPAAADESFLVNQVFN